MRLFNPLCWSVYQFVRQSVSLSVCSLVNPSHFISSIFFFLQLFASVLFPKCSSDLKYGPCSPACNFGSHLSGLVINEKSLNKKIGTNHNFSTILTLIVPNQVEPACRPALYINMCHFLWSFD